MDRNLLTLVQFLHRDADHSRALLQDRPGGGIAGPCHGSEAAESLKQRHQHFLWGCSTARVLPFSSRAWMNMKLGLEDPAGLVPMDGKPLCLHLGSNTRRRSSDMGRTRMVPATRPSIGRTRIACLPPDSRRSRSWLAGRRRSLFGMPRSDRRR
ncbi:hypothetical protein MRX96_007113 [Rhipicephalus microplus]